MIEQLERGHRVGQEVALYLYRREGRLGRRTNRKRKKKGMKKRRKEGRKERKKRRKSELRI